MIRSSAYAKGLIARDIVDPFKEMHDGGINAPPPSLQSAGTGNRAGSRVAEPANRFNPFHSIVYLDCIVFKTLDNKRVINKFLYLALGIPM